jgi:hypothetical protein
MHSSRTWFIHRPNRRGSFGTCCHSRFLDSSRTPWLKRRPNRRCLPQQLSPTRVWPASRGRLDIDSSFLRPPSLMGLRESLPRSTSKALRPRRGLRWRTRSLHRSLGTCLPPYSHFHSDRRSSPRSREDFSSRLSNERPGQHDVERAEAGLQGGGVPPSHESL